MAKQTFMLLMVNWMKPQRKRKGIGNAHNRTLQTRESLNAHTHTHKLPILFDLRMCWLLLHCLT